MKEPKLKQLKKAAPRAKILHAEEKNDEEHELEILEPGLHGPESLTARCTCLLYSVTTVGPKTARDALRQRAVGEHVVHARERAAFDAMIDALTRQPGAANMKLDAKDVHSPGGSGGRAVPPKRRSDGAFPVEYQHVDGFACVMPRGYSRAHAEAVAAHQVERVGHGAPEEPRGSGTRQAPISTPSPAPMEREVVS